MEWGALCVGGRHSTLRDDTAQKKTGLRGRNPGFFETRLVTGYAMASTIALKVALGRIAFDVLTGSGS